METPLAIEACLALGLAGVHGIVAESQAESRCPLGLCLEQGMGWVTLVPRTWTVRQARAAWGQQPALLPLVVAKAGRTTDDAPRRWHGDSGMRQVEVEDSDGRVA